MSCVCATFLDGNMVIKANKGALLSLYVRFSLDIIVHHG